VGAASAALELDVQRYHHRQTNRNTLVIFTSIAVVVTVCWMLFMPAKMPLAALLGPLALTAAVVAVVSTFTIDVTEHELILAFGLGLFRRRVPLSDIVQVERTAVPWWYGVGIKITPSYVTYVVATGPAVAITLSKGMALRISTDDPDALMRALAPRPA
jgi:hypothetical protein